jgi:YD repeat-containing protein
MARRSIASYEDADGNVSKTTYDLDGRPVKTSDNKGSQTIRYDSVSGLPVELEDSAAGVFTAGYDADGNLVKRTLPDGLSAETTISRFGFLLAATDSQLSAVRGSYPLAALAESRHPYRHPEQQLPGRSVEDHHHLQEGVQAREPLTFLDVVDRGAVERAELGELLLAVSLPLPHSPDVLSETPREDLIRRFHTAIRSGQQA